MNLKKKLILLSDKLDRLGMSKEADVVDLTIKAAMESGLIKKLEDTPVDDEVAEEIDT